VTAYYVSYAFVLGLVASVNPCGFPMLPAYVSVFVGGDADGAGVVARLGRALRSAAAVSLGFGVVFAVLGALFDAGLTLFMNWVPWIMVAMGAAFFFLGVIGVVRGHIPVRLPSLRRRRTGSGTWAMVGFGISYATASLTCSMPVFLSGIAGTFTKAGWGEGAITFLSYAAGMSTVLLIVSVAVALARTSVVGLLRRTGRHIDRFASAILVVVGAYLAYYWIVYLEGSAVPGPIAAVECFQSWLVTVLPAHRATLAVAAGVLVVITAGALAARWASRQEGAGRPDRASH
jgi:cytochrome c biogenesis protein CcdA